MSLSLSLLSLSLFLCPNTRKFYFFSQKLQRNSHPSHMISDIERFPAFKFFEDFCVSDNIQEKEIMLKSSHCTSLKACKGEVHNMLSLMRRKRIGSSKARFHSEIPLSEESDIYRQFKMVQETLQRADDLENIDTLTYLRPFLFGIRDGYVSISLNYLLSRKQPQKQQRQRDRGRVSSRREQIPTVRYYQSQLER